MDLNFAGKVVMVTGGASGIGAALSAGFAGCGAKVAIHYCHSFAAQIAKLRENVHPTPGEIEFFQADLTETAACHALIDQVVERFGQIDILINNAGGMVERRRFEELDDDFIERVLHLNVHSVVTLCRAALPLFERQGSGCIVNVGSISARTGGSPGSSIYSAAKAFVSTLTRSLARELADRQIRVNAISPGTIDTAFHERFSSREKLEATRKSIPQQRLGAADDCVGTVLYLASDQLSGYVTGQVIEVNGGQLMA